MVEKKNKCGFQVSRELHGLNKVWVVRRNGKFVTAFRSKNEAQTWMYVHDCCQR